MSCTALIRSFIYPFILTVAVTSQAMSSQWQEPAPDFQFKDADIRMVIEKVGKMTRKNFIVDPNVRGKVSITNASEVTVQQAYDAFLAALAINGYSVLDAGPYTVIRGSRNTQRDNIPVFVNKKPPNKYRMYTMIYSFKHILAEEVATTLRILPSKDGELTPFAQTNQIILTDFGPNLNRVWTLFQALDVPATHAKGKFRRKKKRAK